jgi:hypothetical protein
MSSHRNLIAFAGDQCFASGDSAQVARAARRLSAKSGDKPILAFDAATGEQVELDLRGLDEAPRKDFAAASERQPAPERRGPGRPRLGVIAREVTLLPRHWDWLASQPGGASVALRKLVHQATRANVDKDRTRAAQNAAYRFMSAMAGNRAGFEDAARALFAGDAQTFNRLVAVWPRDVRDQTRRLAAAAFERQKASL